MTDMTDMTPEQIHRELDGIERRIALNEMTAPAAFTMLKHLVSQALSAPRVPEGESVTFWVVYDATTDKKYIKKNATTGALAVFDYEHEAKAVSIRQPGTSFVKITYIRQGE